MESNVRRLLRAAEMTARASVVLLALCLLGAGRPAFIPADATESAQCVPALGDVYWNPAKLPFGPTYGVYKGRPIFEEFMVAKNDFERGRNWQNIPQNVRGAKVDHVDIWFAPNGHDGAPQPHYDVILFFIPHAEHMKICNPSGRLPSFVLQQ